LAWSQGHILCLLVKKAELSIRRHGQWSLGRLESNTRLEVKTCH
jgi:hypothetical protein